MLKIRLQICLILFCAGLKCSGGAENTEMVRYTDTVIPLGGRNLIPNGSFEAGSAGWSSLGLGAGYQNAWAPLIDNWGNLAALHGTVEKSQGSHGQSFLRIRLGGEDTPVFNFDYFYPVNRRELQPLAANLGWIEVKPGQPYTLSLDMRASREGVPAAFGVQNEDAGKSTMGAQEEVLENVALTMQWKRYSRTFIPKYHFLFVLAGPNLKKEENIAVDVDAIQLEEGSKAMAFIPRSDLELGIVPSAVAGVFTTGEPAALKVTAFNNASKPARAEIKFNVTDFADKPVEFPAVDLEVPAQAAIEKLVSLPTSWKGFYRILVNYKTGKTEETRLLRLAIVPPRTTRETVVGVNHAYPTKFLIDLAKKAGVSWYRDWSLKWQHIETERGKLQWEVSDPQMKRVGEQGANLMAMIPFPSADWNSTAPSIETLKAESPRYRMGGKGDDQELIYRARWAWMPQEVNELTGFIKAAVGRYKEEVQVWEFLNEPLFTSYSLPDSNVLRTATLKCYVMDDYLKLLKAAATAIRAANPSARIMGGPGMMSSGRYTVPMVEAGILDYIDIFGVHDYPGLAKPETRIQSNDKLLAAMKEHGGVKPMWMTEFSYFGTDDLPRSPFKPIPGLWSETRFLSEKNVAEYIVRYYTIFLGRGGEKIFLHSGCTGSVNKPGTESCMFADGAVRKVFPAVAVFTEIMGSVPKFVGDKTDGSGIVFAFENGKQATLVLWDPDEKTTISIPAGVTCLDIMGRTVTGPKVRLTGSPVYFIGSPGKAKELLTVCAGTIESAQ
ncbi:MAG: hypothetical protein PHR77_19995 [Kiritimatiellae bacterium]|nr:hypothetical protein [Kiritimatiellia bacterium]MDD5520870.1 hypothetical protein [Kiritimatiellia bacterium]